MMEAPSEAATKVATAALQVYLLLSVYGLYLDCSVFVLLWRLLLAVLLFYMINPMARGHQVLRDSPTLTEPVSNQDAATRASRTWILNLPVLVLHAALYYDRNNAAGLVPPLARSTSRIAGDDAAVLLAWEEKLWGAKFLTFTAAAEPCSGLWLLFCDVATAAVMLVVMTVAAAVNPVTVGTTALKETEFALIAEPADEVDGRTSGASTPVSAEARYMPV